MYSSLETPFLSRETQNRYSSVYIYKVIFYLDWCLSFWLRSHSSNQSLRLDFCIKKARTTWCACVHGYVWWRIGFWIDFVVVRVFHTANAESLVETNFLRYYNYASLDDALHNAVVCQTAYVASLSFSISVPFWVVRKLGISSTRAIDCPVYGMMLYTFNPASIFVSAVASIHPFRYANVLTSSVIGFLRWLWHAVR